MAEQVEIRARFDAEMRFGIFSDRGQEITLDGDHLAGFSPMEMLLASLAGCSGMSVISVLLKKRESVTNYEVHVRGVRAETYPLVYQEITVEHVITGTDVHSAAVERAIELAETRYCPVSIMLGQVTSLRHTYRIIEASASPDPRA
jgi:putative redox protein